MTNALATLIVTAPNGVTWRQRPGGTSLGAEFLTALATMADSRGRVAREWNWWQDGRIELENEHIRDVVRQWDHAEPPPRGYLAPRRAHDVLS